MQPLVQAETQGEQIPSLMTQVAVVVANRRGQMQCQRLLPWEGHAEAEKREQMQQGHHHQAMAQDQKATKQEKLRFNWGEEDKYNLIRIQKEKNKLELIMQCKGCVVCTRSLTL